MGGTGGQLESRVHISAIVLDPGPQLLHALRFGHSISCVSCCMYSCGTEVGWVREAPSAWAILAASTGGGSHADHYRCESSHGSMSMWHNVCTQPTCAVVQSLPIADLLVSPTCACHIPGPPAKERAQGQGAVLLCKRGLLQDGNLAHRLQDFGGLQNHLICKGIKVDLGQPVSGSLGGSVPLASLAIVARG